MGEPLVSGHGNFGSLDADPPAAMRYTECRLQPLADAMLLVDLSEAVVPFGDSFDGSEREPAVLPARLPNLLLNGSSGIAVGMATSIPPHNLGELAAATCLIARRPGATLEEVMVLLPAPDFPTGGVLLGGDGLAKAYRTGNGGFTLRGKVEVEALPGRGTSSGRTAVVIREIPHAGNKAALVQRIAELVNERTMEGVSDVRDESDRDGMRVVLELRRGTDPEPVIAALWRHTRLQVRVSINMIAIVEGAPRALGLLDILREFVAFREKVLRARAAATLALSRDRAHVVGGLLKALGDMDATVSAIRASPDASSAASALSSAVGLTETQAAAVLAMPLRRLTGLESGKLRDEAASLAATISDLEGLLASPQRVTDLLCSEATELAARFGRPRRTRLGASEAEAAATEAAVATAASASHDEECLITLSERGYIKRLRPSEFGGRGGAPTNRPSRGKAAGPLKGDDALLRCISCRDTDGVLVFTQRGRVFRMQADAIPQAGRTAGGTPLPQLIAALAPGEGVTALLAVPRGAGDAASSSHPPSVVMLTQNGWLKRVALSDVVAPRASGLVALKLGDGDALLFAKLSASPSDTVFIAASDGLVAAFALDGDNLSITSRTSRGVIGMSSPAGAHAVGLDILPGGAGAQQSPQQPGADDSDGEGAGASAAASQGPWALLVTAQGYAKRVDLSAFRRCARPSKGLKALRLAEGDALAAFRVVGLPPPATAPAGSRAKPSHAAGGDGVPHAEVLEEEVVVATAAGIIDRSRVRDVPQSSRAARGVRLVNLDADDSVKTVALLPGVLLPKALAESTK